MGVERLLPHEVQSALAVVRQALREEIAGQRFYSEAAFYCIDLWAKEVFASLAQEEQNHIQVLLLEYESLNENQPWLDLQTVRASQVDVDITQVDFGDGDTEPELFPLRRTVEQAVDRRSDDLAALALGIKMEQAAIDLYTRTARENADHVVQTIYTYLAEEETRHYHQLKERWENLAGTSFPESDLERSTL